MYVLYARVEFTNDAPGRNARNRSVTQAQTEAANRGLTAVPFTWPYDGFSWTGAQARDVVPATPEASRYVLYLAFGAPFEQRQAVQDAADALNTYLDANSRADGVLGTADIGG